jgi:hypothetical protein
MQGMAAEARAIFLDLDLLRPAGHFDLGPIIQIAGLRALEPDHLAAFFGHDTTVNLIHCSSANRSLQAALQQYPLAGIDYFAERDSGSRGVFAPVSSGLRTARLSTGFIPG